MKNLIAISLFMLLSSFTACEPEVTFSEPQPQGADNLSEIPAQLHGVFRATDKHSFLTIDAKMIQNTVDFDYKFHRNELDEEKTMKLIGDTLIDNENNKYPVKSFGDSLIAYLYNIDTIFELKGENTVRKWKGNWFMSKRYYDKGWDVTRMGFRKGQLTVCSLTKDDVPDSWPAVAESVSDSSKNYNNLRVSRKQFRRLNSKGFTEEKVYERGE